MTDVQIKLCSQQYINKMKFTILTTLTTLVALSSAQPTQLHGLQTHDLEARKKSAAVSGKMTFYTPGQGSCGVINTENDMIVAVAPSVFGTYANPNASPACKKTMTITCNGKTVKAAVKDRCAGCGANDIDVSPAVFKVCGDLNAGTMTVSWTTN